MIRRTALALLAVALLPTAACKTPATQLLVEAVPDSQKTEFTVWDEKGSAMIVESGVAGTPVAVPPGRYLVTRRGDQRWVWAKDLDVARGETKTIRLGALRALAIEGVEDDKLSIRDTVTDQWVSELDHVGTLLAAPAGKYRIHAYLDNRHVWGDLAVTEGKISELPLAALNVLVPPGTSDDGLTVHDPATGDITAERRPVNKPFYTRVGPNRVQAYLELTVLGSVDAPAGKVTDVATGALRWDGPGTRFQLLDAAGGRARKNTLPNGIVFAVAPGKWKIADEEQKAILAEVTVSAGAVSGAKK